MTTTPDALAVDHVLQRMQRDPRLAYLLGYGSESYDLLTAARAERAGVDTKTFRKQFDDSLSYQPLPPIQR